MKLIKWAWSVLLALSLVACGGGGGDAGTPIYGGGDDGSGTTIVPSVSVVLSTSTVTSDTSSTVTATVTSASGAAVKGATVKFSLASGYALLGSDTVITDSQGIATTQLSVKPGQSYGVDTLTAAVTVGSNSASAKTTFAANSATTVELLAASTSAATNGDTVKITATVKGAGNVGLGSAPITFTTDSGTLRSPSSATDSTGTASVTFTVGADKSNRTVNIVASSGSASSTLVLPVEGTKLSVSGATTMALSASGTLSVKATDSSGSGISNTTIRVTSALGNTLSASSVTTDSNGLATLTYTAAKSGTDTVTFTGLGTSATTNVTISSEDFAFVSPASQTEIPVGSTQTLTARYRVNNVGVSGRTVTFASTGGALTATSAVTDSTGSASVVISSTSAAPATVLAQLSGSTAQATLPVVFVAKTPAKLVLQANPTAIGPNTSGNTTNQVQVIAKVTDANANPVSGATVNFSRTADPSGGNYLQPQGVTDVNGVATVQYASGPQATANNAVVLRGTVASNSAIYGDAQLTVSQAALFIALGTGNTISNVDEQTYKKQWTVYVTDVNGVAVSNVDVTARILPVNYGKGWMVWSDDASAWVVYQRLWCANEDAIHGETDTRSFNGVLDDSAEDVNVNGSLQPGNVVSLASGTVKTDSAGRATLVLTYAESYVPWVQVKLVVQAVVSGTASSTTTVFVIPGDANDFTDKNKPPAGVSSPFGIASVCTDPS